MAARAAEVIKARGLIDGAKPILSECNRLLTTVAKPAATSGNIVTVQQC